MYFERLGIYYHQEEEEDAVDAPVASGRTQTIEDFAKDYLVSIYGGVRDCKQFQCRTERTFEASRQLCLFLIFSIAVLAH